MAFPLIDTLDGNSMTLKSAGLGALVGAAVGTGAGILINAARDNRIENYVVVSPLLGTGQVRTFVALDISTTALQNALKGLAEEHPAIAMLGICCDHSQLRDLPEHPWLAGQRRIGFFPGSSLGNFSPTDAIALLQRFRTLLKGGPLLLGLDQPRDPQLLEADADAEYAAVIDIDLNAIKEPIVACPNDPDNVKTLSAVAGDKVDEVFIGSCMTNIGHYRAAATVLEGQGQNTARLWVCPPTRMDEETLKEEGYYATFEAAGSRMEMPGCSLCMGNQARVEDNTTVFSTSTRNFNNRLGKGAQVYLGSAELAAVCALLGRIPTADEYRSIAAEKIDPLSDELYRYLNFDQISGFEDQGRVMSADEEAAVLAEA